MSNSKTKGTSGSFYVVTFLLLALIVASLLILNLSGRGVSSVSGVSNSSGLVRVSNVRVPKASVDVSMAKKGDTTDNVIWVLLLIGVFTYFVYVVKSIVRKYKNRP